MNCSPNRLNRYSHFHPRLPRTLAAGLVFLALLGAVTGRAQTTIESVLYSFTGSPDGAAPVGGLVLGQDNALYGTTILGGNVSSTGGTLFKLNLDGSGYRVLYNFNANGSLNTHPNSQVTVMQGNDGMLYGTVITGGANNDGFIFKITLDGSGYTVVHDFGNTDSRPTSLLQGNDGALYGTCVDAVFKLSPSGSNYLILHTFTDTPDGADLNAKLIQGSDNALYGTTYLGGTNGWGTVFKINPDGSGYTILHHFNVAPDASSPSAGVIQGSDGALYGIANAGGTNNLGAVFKLDPGGSGYTVLHSFIAADGDTPWGGLIQGVGNVLYGTTASGGPHNGGTVFQLGLDGSNYDVLYGFNSSPDGSHSYAGLLPGPATATTGVLYGTTSIGGSGGSAGTVFALLVNPPLTLTPVSSQTASHQTVVFWPAWALNFVLQTSTNLTTGPWTTVSNAIPVSGVQLTNAQPAAFYRLTRQ